VSAHGTATTALGEFAFARVTPDIARIDRCPTAWTSRGGHLLIDSGVGARGFPLVFGPYVLGEDIGVGDVVSLVSVLYVHTAMVATRRPRDCRRLTMTVRHRMQFTLAKCALAGLRCVGESIVPARPLITKGRSHPSKKKVVAVIARARRSFRAGLADYGTAIANFTPNARRLVWAHGIQNSGLGMLITVFAIYIKSAGLSEAVVGGFEGSVAIASAVVCLLAPPLIAVLGYRTLFLAAAGAFALSRFGAALVPTAGVLLFLGLVGGLGVGVMQAATAAFYADNSSPRERTHLFSIDLVVRVGLGFAGSVAGGFLPLLFRSFMTDVDAYRATVAVAAVLLAASAIPAWGITGRVGKPGRSMKRYLVTMRRFGSWGHTARLLVPQLLISFGAGLVMPFVSLYLKHHLGATIDQVGMIQGVSMLVMGVAALGGPIVARRVGLIRGLVFAQAISLPFLIAIPLTTSLRIAVVLFWIRTALMNMSWPLFSQFSMEGVPSREKPVVAAAFAFAWSMGWLGGSVVGGRIMEFSYTVPYFVTAGCYAMGVIASWTLLRKRDVSLTQYVDQTAMEVASEGAGHRV